MTTAKERHNGPAVPPSFVKSVISKIKAPVAFAPASAQPAKRATVEPEMSDLQSPEAAPEAAAPSQATDRCQFSFADGRQCRMPRAPHHDCLCAHHASKEAAENGVISFPELEPLCADLSTATNINRAMSRVFLLLAQGRMDGRQALAFASLARLLLRTIPEIQDEWIATIGRTAYLDILKGKITEGKVTALTSPPIRPSPKAPAHATSSALNAPAPTRLDQPSPQNAAPPVPIQGSTASGASPAGAPSPLSSAAIASNPVASAQRISPASPDRPSASSSAEPSSLTPLQPNPVPAPPPSVPPRTAESRSASPEQNSEANGKPPSATNTPRLLWVESLQRFVAESSL